MLGSLLSLVLVLAPQYAPGKPTVAEPSRTSIQWLAPTTCPAQVDVQAAITQLAGRAPRSGELTATAVVAQEASAWTLQLSVVHEASVFQQQLVASDCATLADATALVIAVLLDPIAAARAAPPRVDRAVSTGPQKTDRPPTSVDPPARPRWKVGMQLRLGGEYAAIPRGTAGGRIGLMFRRKQLELRLDGSYWVPRRTARGTAAGAVVQLGTAAASACIVPSVRRVELPLCGGLEAGATQARGLNVANARPVTVPWVALTASPGVRWWLRPRFALLATAEVFAPIVRPALKLGPAADGRTIHRAGPVGARGLIGIVVGFSRFGDGSEPSRE